MKRYGQFEYPVMQIGVWNASETFQLLVTAIPHGYIDAFVIFYIGELLSFSNETESHY